MMSSLPLVRARSNPSRLLLAAILAASVACLAACSTTEGFGTDVKNLGGAIEGSAERNK